MNLSPSKMRSSLKYFVLILCLNFIEGLQLFGCGYEYNSETKGLYKYVAEPATWYNARKRCAEEGAVLASPTGNEMQDAIESILNTTSKLEVVAIFTGIHATASNPVYHDADGKPYPDFRDWEPMDGQNDTCIIMYNNGDGSLENVACEETYPYVCYHPIETDKKLNECGTTDLEYHLDSRTNKCYKIHTVARSFSQAVVKCAEEGGHLAILNSDTEAKLLGEMYHTGIRAWVGIHDFKEKGDWRTIYGPTLMEAGYAGFAPGEPNNAHPGQHCGSIYRSGQIDDFHCWRLMVSICEKSPYYNAVCSSADERVYGFYKP